MDPFKFKRQFFILKIKEIKIIFKRNAKFIEYLSLKTIFFNVYLRLWNNSLTKFLDVRSNRNKFFNTNDPQTENVYILNKSLSIWEWCRHAAHSHMHKDQLNVWICMHVLVDLTENSIFDMCCNDHRTLFVSFTLSFVMSIWCIVVVFLYFGYVSFVPIRNSNRARILCQSIKLRGQLHGTIVVVVVVMSSSFVSYAYLLYTTYSCFNSIRKTCLFIETLKRLFDIRKCDYEHNAE